MGNWGGDECGGCGVLTKRVRCEKRCKKGGFWVILGGRDGKIKKVWE